ncbi:MULTISPECIES: helix-turn-helix domain-containing protein [unclassified Bradyrhizobium]|uniref:helix-turn-helix domain-containing protein n=1 Tax=unclassified Bradyrhizobium TaxID=2631580 RepID=UPI002916D32A|nr:MULTISPECIES: helix-turn-helix domain-containing protein [unclassified Bradyrhizobium]
MPIKLSLKEALGRQAAAKAEPPGPSASPTHRLLLEARRLARPVELAKALIRLGLSLKRAHSVVDRLASGDLAAIGVSTDDIDRTISTLRSLGLESSVADLGHVDVKQIREQQKLSQTEFALLYGFDERTLQNWEQHRNEPDRPARVLLKIIETDPEVVVRAVYDQRHPHGHD